jgi:hypothetical protein
VRLTHQSLTKWKDLAEKETWPAFRYITRYCIYLSVCYLSVSVSVSVFVSVSLPACLSFSNPSIHPSRNTSNVIYIYMYRVCSVYILLLSYIYYIQSNQSPRRESPPKNPKAQCPIRLRAWQCLGLCCFTRAQHLWSIRYVALGIPIRLSRTSG